MLREYQNGGRYGLFDQWPLNGKYMHFILSMLLTPELGTSPTIVKHITLLKSILNPDIASIIAAKLIKLYLPIIN